MSGISRQIMLFVNLLVMWFIVARASSSNRNFRIEVQSSQIPLKSASMPNKFQDLTADLSMDGNDVTCASSDWVSSRSIEFTLQEPTGIHAVSLLMHKYVDVNVEVLVSNNTGKTVLCNTLQLNSGTEREVTVICNHETNGGIITVKDLRNANEFFVICEASAFGAPAAIRAPEEISGTDLQGVYIGCGVALLVIVVIVVFAFFWRKKSRDRRASEAHSLNTLSMMTSRTVVQRQREPIPSPRPRSNLVSRSIPNPYDRPLSVKDSLTIYETIPGDEPPYLTVIGEKDLYDDASSSKK